MVLAHPQKCVACHLCEGACSFFHEGAFQPAKTRIFVHDFVDEAVYLPVTCFHCKDAPCLSNCPTYAITRKPAARCRSTTTSASAARCAWSPAPSA